MGVAVNEADRTLICDESTSVCEAAGIKVNDDDLPRFSQFVVMPFASLEMGSSAGLFKDRSNFWKTNTGGAIGGLSIVEVALCTLGQLASRKLLNVEFFELLLLIEVIKNGLFLWGEFLA